MKDEQLKEFELAISRHLQELTLLANSDKNKDKLHLHGTTMNDVLKSVNELKMALEKINNDRLLKSLF